MKNKFTAASIRDPGFVGKDKEQAACIEEGGGGVCVCVCVCERARVLHTYTGVYRFMPMHALTHFVCELMHTLTHTYTHTEKDRHTHGDTLTHTGTY